MCVSVCVYVSVCLSGAYVFHKAKKCVSDIAVTQFFKE